MRGAERDVREAALCGALAAMAVGRRVGLVTPAAIGADLAAPGDPRDGA